jgi:outer membrane autotransporter protein
VSLDPQLKQTDNSALFDFPITASGNQLTIQPVAHLSDAAANLGTSQKAVAGYLQKLFDSGASMDDGFTALAHLSGGTDYATSLKSMTGSQLGAFGAFRVNSSRAFANDLYQGCRELTFDRNTGDTCSWARISGSSSDQDARADLEGYHADAQKLEVGGQVGLSDRLALVGSVGSEKSQFHGDDGSSHIKGDAAVAGVGLNFANGPLELSGAVDGAYGWYRSYRTITVGSDSETANAKPRQWQLGAHLRAAYEVPFAGRSYAKPFLEGHAIRVANDSFTEDGNSPFRLTVNGRSDTAVLGGGGIELGTYMPTHFGAELHPFISAAALFGEHMQWTTTAQFAGQGAGPSFDIRTAGPGTVGRFAIGADLMNSKNLSFSLLYNPEVGSGYSSQGGAARISYTF